MACETLLIAGFTQPTNCSKPVPLYYDTVWFFNRSEITSLTPSSSLGQITDVVMTSPSVGFAVQVEKDSYDVKEELQEDGSYTVTVAYKLATDTVGERNHVAALKGAKLMCIGRTKNDTFKMAGVNYKGNVGTPASSTAIATGVELKVNTDSNSSDAFGNDIQLVGTGFTEKQPHFYETSLANTLSNIASYL